jgi:hypothetical protein
VIPEHLVELRAFLGVSQPWPRSAPRTAVASGLTQRP